MSLSGFSLSRNSSCATDQVGGRASLTPPDQEDDALAQQPAVDVVGALAAARLFDDDGHHAQASGFRARSCLVSINFGERRAPCRRTFA